MIYAGIAIDDVKFKCSNCNKMVKVPSGYYFLETSFGRLDFCSWECFEKGTTKSKLVALCL